ncbi:MAG: tetratricopeptide repeat protein [Bryobacteraceae bacterium]
MRRLLCALALAAVLHPAAARAETVLVLPFFNESKPANLDWIGESIAENIREALASEGLLVLDREDRLEGCRRLGLRAGALLTNASVIKLGEALDAAQVVYGSYEVSEDARPGLRIAARVLDLRRIRKGPEYAESGALEDLAALQTRLAWQTLQFLAPEASPSEQQFMEARPPVRLDAMENYIRGLLAGSSEQKHRLFTQAARLDERFSQPCFQLGKAYWLKKEYRIAAGWLARVRRSDSHYLEAQFLLGLCRYHTGDFAVAEICFRTVAVSVPLNEVYNNLGAVLSRRGSPAAVENFRKALEGDSADPDYRFNLGYALWRAKQFDAAAESFRAALDRNPDDSEAIAFLGRALKREDYRASDARLDGRERLKTNYEETAYRQLKAELERKK